MIEVIFNYFPILISVIALMFSIFSYSAGVRHDRKRDTLEAYNRLQREVFDNLNKYSPEDIREIAVHNRSAEYKELSAYLARTEHFCIGIKKKIYDKKVFYSLAHGYFDGYQMKSRINPLLEAKNGSSNSSEQFYSGIYYVLEQMEKISKKRNDK